MTAPEVWLRGRPVEGVPPLLQPVAHSLLQCREELERLLPPPRLEARRAEDRQQFRPVGRPAFRRVLRAAARECIRLLGRGERIFEVLDTKARLPHAPNVERL